MTFSSPFLKRIFFYQISIIIVKCTTSFQDISTTARKFISVLTSLLACAIKEASVNLITVPSLTTGSIACPWRGGKVLPKKTIAG